MNTHNPFTDQPETWWDPGGPFWTLHAINPIRLKFINQHVSKNQIGLDIGCGGGILTEPLSKSHKMTGIDIDHSLINLAKNRPNTGHIQYINGDPRTQINTHESFDFIVCLEVLEHVEDPESMVTHISNLVKPGGLIIYSTLNRNPISFLGSIIAAEYILNILPKNTHQYDKFIKPSELTAWNLDNQCQLIDITGIHFNPITRQFFTLNNTLINYIACFKKEAP
ncbi:bifunctional 2-polyprenyl-6-hydroxyphenol methylase/3-demethylubiquinol 3-O-methyltransferase UbiG [Candidatus Comchoanobacter bicostacola]|uniref:Bifunctional 2-polyprenyl-6-hydroxyphenol methylase/3-demethylubiquinol 3-O-methyltransferase UbiG n=1 Tax=Candidatus Comchoanobacter bicostacola TaxID=2919598 RepID=A0ABY5DKA2_9GAMM|nr:bifunctional 2-polyprenyl-6-hydroxyphenol methylase/3-demethylubiquinol 3-O-methyltransferase UbiG [Candidatus Comchoanobacter bicostacola]UTC24222.1 bifunctional 2-polyprenyl-6-hydroxyphenol methylase/3-demethylubiquinol 3-O-methyltransferase UbiG [Candidatus Comchoanobacter bicostacola]